ncbi:hypothetical protein QBC35DRAFT_55458 [Podospora australis]|uniref:Uncharacterized protein n=1 Tax=Podospora australis TaxID=1536484 RepID=A0AAN6X021_9PEZI|nr:hypothetical protein QBC35DRAFT_55458 [Podospora australis]
MAEPISTTLEPITQPAQPGPVETGGPVSVASTTTSIRGDNGIFPAPCYSSCNNAYLEFQRKGRIPEACVISKDSFMYFYMDCRVCVLAQPGQTVTTMSQIEDLMRSLLEYCSSEEPTSSARSMGNITSSSSASSGVLLTTFSITAGKPNASNRTIPTSPSPAEQTAPLDQVNTPSSSSSSSKTPVIVGATVGSVVGVVLLGLLSLILLRRKHRRQRALATNNHEDQSRWEKSELDGNPPDPKELDGIPKAELDGDIPVERAELDDTSRAAKAISNELDSVPSHTEVG